MLICHNIISISAPIKLAGSSLTGEGVILVYDSFQSVWTGVCATQGQFDLNDGRIVCKQIGLDNIFQGI